jgi:epoxyqueuosine reductase
MSPLSQQEWLQWQQNARKLGFLDLGAAEAAPVTCSQTVLDWLDRGDHAEMEWYRANLAKRLDPSLIWQQVRTMLVFATAHHPAPVQLGPYRMARYAAGDDYHELLQAALQDFCRSQIESRQGSYRIYVDTGPILERYWAQKAGLGWIGRSGNLISRSAGSYLLLAVVLTDLVLPPANQVPDSCGSCRACIDACPTQAIRDDRTVDARACLSWLTIEKRGPFDRDWPLANWVFGCDICQEVCPWTEKFSRAAGFHELLPRPAYGELSGEDLAQLDQEAFATLFRKSPVKRTKLAGLLRNMKQAGRGGPADQE